MVNGPLVHTVSQWALSLSRPEYREICPLIVPLLQTGKPARCADGPVTVSARTVQQTHITTTSEFQPRSYALNTTGTQALKRTFMALDGLPGAFGQGMRKRVASPGAAAQLRFGKGGAKAGATQEGTAGPLQVWKGAAGRARRPHSSSQTHLTSTCAGEAAQVAADTCASPVSKRELGQVAVVKLCDHQNKPGARQACPSLHPRGLTAECSPASPQYDAQPSVSALTA